MTVTTALYRRYRPDSFADVIGQAHVTEPLGTALRKNRVNHAYLFSGPRGCGKTTSARILARCLNCAEGPTDTPCGKCASCVELARGGSGSLDVIEIDAASHGGVDDARDLRERATYAPVRDRYKIFIIDEAHMVTSAGFNALLKIVEEPPEHIKFIFATTEPDKVIGTIRSRTHHYPFRLVPPEPLMAYLELLCAQENVPVAPGVLSLVIRAGGGSVRDSLSVLDQLMAGAGTAGLDYELAVALLGYTHASLLDDVVEAVAASDAATVFRAVDRVIQTGHDPRRFVEDLLERFRDLIIVQAMPENAQSILRGMPADQIARMQNQAHNLGAAELSRAADVTNTALTEMTGATSPRLHLELLCARILLPSSEQTERGIAARIDRVERRLNYAGNDVAAPARPPAQAPAPVPAAEATAAATAPVAPAAGTGGAAAVTTAAGAASAPPEAGTAPAPPAPAERDAGPAREQLSAPRVSTSDWPVNEAGAPSGTTVPTSAEPPAPAEATPSRPAPTDSRQPLQGGAAETAASAAPAAQPAGGTGADVEVLRRAWPEILQALTTIKRSTWALVEPNAQVRQFDGQVLTLAFTTSGLAGAFGRADHADNLRQAIQRAIGIDCQISAVTADTNSASSVPGPKAPASPAAAATSADAAWGLAPPTEQAPPAPSPAAPAGSSAAPEERPTPPAASPSKVDPPSSLRRDSAAGAPPIRRQDPELDSGAHPPGTADPSGSYANPDDDWGPPLDEDAPPLDEEPPMDWMPSGPVPAAERPGPSAPGASAGGPQPVPALHRAAPAAPANAAPAPGGIADPWARAVEQSPGVWTVGTGSNVRGHAPSAAEPTAPSAHAPEPERTRYEPAAAQIPERAAELSPAPAAAASAPDGWGAPPPARVGAADLASIAAAGIAPIPAPSAPVAATPAAPVGGVPAGAPGVPPAPTTASRQSLYQRLSNSPEAEAGRAKAPARATAAATYVQDVPSADDETIEESGVFGRAAVERILGGKLVEERSLDGSPLVPRY